MALSVFHYVLAIISLYFFIDGVLHFWGQRRRTGILKSLTVLTIWAGIFILSVFPSLALYVSEKLGLGETLNTLIFTGFVVVFVIIFRMLYAIERTERAINLFVTRRALQDLERKINRDFN